MKSPSSIQDPKVFCIICIVTFWVILFSANSKSIQNWKQKLIIWNDVSYAEISKFLNCCLPTFIFLWLVYLYCSNTNLEDLLTWVCSCMTFQCFGWNIFIFWPNFRDQPHKCTYFSVKLASIAGIFLKKVSLMYEHSFPIPFPCNLNYISLCFIHDSMKSFCKYLIPLKPSHVLKTDPQYFGLFIKFQDTKEISM